MSDEHKKKTGIPDAHDLVQTGTKWEQRKGRDIDYYFYDEVDADGNIQFMHRAANDIRVVGVFLKSKSNGEERVIQCTERLKDISSRM
ncbi:hypothetical protein Q673_16400 [Marinobacter sp. EN3]|uniref:hypothetical protein n=1 Tax=Marinobacter sp. EN3 TaxID=1397533 RepID=UPI0003B7E734|nr:hypothetical protein [Marinobacter sp. EN3]ERS09627.1 hypothetical protein Q673_16400 [Marinobacter sp. EN3]